MLTVHASLRTSSVLSKFNIRHDISKSIHKVLSAKHVQYSQNNLIQKRNFVYTTYNLSNITSVIHLSSKSNLSSNGQKSNIPAATPVLHAMGRALDSRQLKRLNDYTKEDWIPGVIYGQDEQNQVFKRLVCVSKKAFLNHARKRAHAIENTIFELVVNDKTFTKADIEKFKISYVDSLAAKAAEEEAAAAAAAALIHENNNVTTTAATTNESSNPSNPAITATTNTPNHTKTVADNTTATTAAVGEVSYRVVPRQIDYHPLTDEPLSVNFLRYWPGMNRLRIPIKYINDEDCQDFKKGGHLIEVNRYVECICDDEVPQYLIVDLTDKKIGDVIKLKDMDFPKSVRPSKAVNAVEFVAGVIKCITK